MLKLSNYRLTFGFLSTAILLACFVRGAHGEPAASLPNMLDDARLHSICFIDPDRGWAVGDRGVIWRTNDGGRKWEQQASGVTGRLNEVSFVDQQHGWIVGGWTHPYTHQTSAIVLRTTDGGEQWKASPNLLLPALVRVRFFSPNDGMAFGASSAMYPTGVFHTHDGGRSWIPLAERRQESSGIACNAGDFIDLQRGALAGTRGELALVAYNRVAPARVPNLGPRVLRDLRLRGATGWLVGDGGLVLQTLDGGASWREPEGRLPNGALQFFDYRSVATYGEHCWIVGAPGSIVLHSPDHGRSWEQFSTEQPLPLDSIAFLDEKRGWAVGAMGVILGTRDGGHSWHRLRGAINRSAYVGLFAQAESIPWELFSWYSANEGYVGSLEILTRSDDPASALSKATALEPRVDEALVSAGGSSAHIAWNFPVRPRELQLTAPQIVAAWDQVNHGSGRATMEEYVVRLIRQWRPNVIFTDDGGSVDENSVQHDINQIILAAVKKAADPAAYPEHKTLAGLDAWQTKKVFGQLKPGHASTFKLTTAQLATNLGACCDDYAASARGLINDRFASAPAQWSFRLLVNQLPDNVSMLDCFAGLHLPAGGDARRQGGATPLINVDSLSKLAQQRRLIENLIAKSGDRTQQGAAWLGELDDVTRGFPPSSAGAILFQLAQRYQRQGQFELAAETLQRLAQTYPDHELTDSALLWLVQYYTSSEVALRLKKRTVIQNEIVQAAIDPQALEAGHVESALSQTSEALPNQSNFPTPTPVEQDGPKQARYATAFGEYVNRMRPGLFAEPSLRFPLYSAQRQLGATRETEQFCNHLAAVAPSAAWRSCAQAELWLRRGVGVGPKPVLNCSPAAERPRLDGDLSDSAWQNAQSATLHSALRDDAEWPAQVMFISDDQFLFLAIRCQHAKGCEYPTAETTRSRDADLSDHDRVDVLLDINRDYASYYRLTIDHRGWTNDECWHDKSWDPRWYVASADDGQQWTIEAAIPWSELTSSPPPARSAWAVGLQRTVPHVGFQSWTQPATIAPAPEGFGLLLFQ